MEERPTSRRLRLRPEGNPVSVALAALQEVVPQVVASKEDSESSSKFLNFY